VNANFAAKKCGIKLDRSDFFETRSAVYANWSMIRKSGRRFSEKIML
jgi:hypothetical protein